MTSHSRVRLAGASLFAATLGFAAPAHAVVGFADVVLDYSDSGAGPIPGPYGSNGGGFPVPVSVDVVLGDTPNDFLSLPTGSFVTVGFDDELVLDGPGDDLFIDEAGDVNERADIFVSSDFINFVFLGTADGGALTPFDLADIGFTGFVEAVRIVGLDTFGGSPGFDVTFVQVLPGAFVPTPEPAALALLLGGVAALGARARRTR